MIHHQNADAMVLASARLRGIPPWTSAILNIIRGECLSNAHWLGPWRQHLMTNYGLRQNHRKIIGKTKKSAFCVPYSVAETCAVRAWASFSTWTSRIVHIYHSVIWIKYNLHITQFSPTKSTTVHQPRSLN